MRLLYNIGIYLYFFAASVAGLFNRKAFLLVSGRKGLIKSLRQKMAAAKGRDVLWFHCSSVGEFEQARPLIERFRKEEPDKFILITFFSPSGYELRKNFGSADVVSYLPMDTVRNVRRFLDVVRPSTAIFVKYEFWYNYLNLPSGSDIFPLVRLFHAQGAEVLYHALRPERGVTQVAVTYGYRKCSHSRRHQI